MRPQDPRPLLRRPWRIAGAMAAAVLVIGSAAQMQSAGTDGEWRAWAADKASTRYSALDQINRSTVKNLVIAWRQSANPDALKETMPNVRPAPTNYQNTPLKVGGLVYMSTGMGLVAALDAATGRVAWIDH